MKRPDILLIVLDTHRADHLSCYGYPLQTSPHLDALASDGTRFQHAVAPAHWTLPSHASLFTGRYPSEHATHQMDAALPAELPTLAERLKGVHYYTAGISHNPLIGMAGNGLTRGFDAFRNYNFLSAGLLTSNLSRANGRAGASSRLRRHLRFLLAELLDYNRQTPLHRLSPLALAIWQGLLQLRGHTKHALARQSLEAATRLLTSREPAGRDQPIFLFINLMGTHVPYAPPRWATDRFLIGALGRRSAASLVQQASRRQVEPANWLAMVPAEDDDEMAANAVYDAEIAAQDGLLGDFIRALRANGRFEETLVIVTADHGEHLGRQQRLSHTFGVYEDLVHVPLIIRDPTGCLPRGRTLQPSISTRRLFHTILTVAGAATSPEAMLALKSDEKGVDASHEAVVAEGMPLQWAIERVEQVRPGLVPARGQDRPSRAIYADPYKLLLNGDRVELYALDADPGESVNLVDERPRQVEQMTSALDEFLSSIDPATSASWQPDEDPQTLRRLRALGYIN